jgi:hypothetical protein
MQACKQSKTRHELEDHKIKAFVGKLNPFIHPPVVQDLCPILTSDS